jgi:hypothetical protein
MCSSEQPSTSAFLANLRVPMPLPRKLAIIARNTGLKVIRLKSCCGHPGEPGC